MVGVTATRRSSVLPVVLALGLLSGCGSADAPSQEVPAEVRGISMKPELSPETGAVVLPADRFVESPLEMDLLATASAVEVSRCASEQGVTVAPPELSADPVYASEHYFGPWTVAQAERFGFVRPMTQADLQANGIAAPGSDPAADAGADGETSDAAPESGEDDLTEKDWEIIDGCASSSGSELFTEALTHVGPWYEQFASVQDAMLDEDAAREAIDDLKSCFKDKGLVSGDKDRPWVPRGADASEISAEQIRLALDVVACKDEVDFTRRMAEVESSLQAPIIAKYAGELVAKRAQLDEAIAQAQALGLG